MDYRDLRNMGWIKAKVTVSPEAFAILREQRLDEQINEYILSREDEKNDNRQTK